MSEKELPKSNFFNSFKKVENASEISEEICGDNDEESEEEECSRGSIEDDTISSTGSQAQCLKITEKVSFCKPEALGKQS